MTFYENIEIFKIFQRPLLSAISSAVDGPPAAPHGGGGGRGGGDAAVGRGLRRRAALPAVVGLRPTHTPLHGFPRIS